MICLFVIYYGTTKKIIKQWKNENENFKKYLKRCLWIKIIGKEPL